MCESVLDQTAVSQSHDERFFFLLLPIDEQIIGNRGLYFLLGATLVVLATKKQPFSLDLVAHDEYVSLHRGIVN